ncbi:hypothetical protein ES703_71219 [subsurface metagenome]
MTWTDETLISDYSGMENYDQHYPSIAVDSNDYLHIVWYGMASGFTTYPQIWYAKYTASWIAPVRISTYAGMENYDQGYPSIALDSNDYRHIVWNGMASSFTTSPQIWYAKYTTSWVTPVRISTYAEMENHDQNYNSIAIDSKDYLHVGWQGKALGFTTEHQIWYAKYTTSWVTPVRISTYTGMEDNNQGGVSIATDSHDYLHVLWHGMANLWYRAYTDSWQNILFLQPTGNNYGPQLRWSRYPTIVYETENDTFAVTNENGTIVWTGDGDLNVTDVEDIIDEDIIGYGDPEDPNPPGWDDPFLTVHRFKLILFIIGMTLFVGSPVYGFTARPEAATWIMLMMNMLIGVALLWSLQTM